MKLKNTLPWLAMLSLMGCQSWVYHPDLSQGNTWTEAQVTALHVGMSSQEVQDILGMPLLKDPFHPHRWDYLQTFRKGDGATKMQEHLILYFESDRLVRIETALADDTR